jgi:hypothetical protein
MSMNFHAPQEEEFCDKPSDCQFYKKTFTMDLVELRRLNTLICKGDAFFMEFPVTALLSCALLLQFFAI